MIDKVSTDIFYILYTIYIYIIFSVKRSIFSYPKVVLCIGTMRVTIPKPWPFYPIQIMQYITTF